MANKIMSHSHSEDRGGSAEDKSQASDPYNPVGHDYGVLSTRWQQRPTLSHRVFMQSLSLGLF